MGNNNEKINIKDIMAQIERNQKLVCQAIARSKFSSLTGIFEPSPQVEVTKLLFSSKSDQACMVRKMRFLKMWAPDRTKMEKEELFMKFF